jgi:putative nucleotidyltransferase with HDIG domain
MGMIDLNRLVEEARELGPLPASVTRLGSVLAQPPWELSEVVGIVALDPVLTASVLRFANSVGAGAQRSVATVDAAVLRIGGGAVASIAVAVAVRGRLAVALPEYGADESRLWRHSVASALSVQCAKRVVKPVPEQAFTAALLHDVGKLVLARHLRGAAAKYLRSCREQGAVSGAEAESELLDVNHGELGAVVAEHWNLPEAIVQGIRHHHTPEAASTDEGRGIARLVALGDCVAKLIGADLDVAPSACGCEHEGLRRSLGIAADAFERLCESVSSALEDTVAIYE